MNDLLVSLDARNVAELLRREPPPPWWDLKSLRGVFGGDAGAARTLAHDFGPDARDPEYAFVAADVTESYGASARDIKRSVVVLKWREAALPPALVAFDWIVSADAAVRKRWQLASPQRALTHTAVLPAANRPSAQAAFLNVIRADGDRLAPSDWEPIVSVELAGVRLADRVLVFHLDSYAAGSAVSFDVGGKGTLKYLLTGLAPGDWEIWRDGFLEDTQRFVKPRALALYFEGPAGGYFLRHLN